MNLPVATLPCKRSRIDDEVKTTNKLFFIDKLPDEVIENVCRYFADVPSAKDWRFHINFAGNRGLFDMEGPLNQILFSPLHALALFVDEPTFLLNQTRTKPLPA